MTTDDTTSEIKQEDDAHTAEMPSDKAMQCNCRYAWALDALPFFNIGFLPFPKLRHIMNAVQVVGLPNDHNTTNMVTVQWLCNSLLVADAEEGKEFLAILEHEYRKATNAEPYMGNDAYQFHALRESIVNGSYPLQIPAPREPFAMNRDMLIHPQTCGLILFDEDTWHVLLNETLKRVPQ